MAYRPKTKKERYQLRVKVTEDSLKGIPKSTISPKIRYIVIHDNKLYAYALKLVELAEKLDGNQDYLMKLLRPLDHMEWAKYKRFKIYKIGNKFKDRGSKW